MLECPPRACWNAHPHNLRKVDVGMPTLRSEIRVGMPTLIGKTICFLADCNLRKPVVGLPTFAGRCDRDVGMPTPF